MTTKEQAEHRQAAILNEANMRVTFQGDAVRSISDYGVTVSDRDGRKYLFPWHRVLSVSTGGQDDLLRQEPRHGEGVGKRL